MSDPASLSAIGQDYFWMAQAIKLAEKGRYTTTPNPRVGCVILNASGDKVGEGYHIQAGTPHAEVHALRSAGEQARGGTAYVTLEPCSHFGRTPPCANALIDAGLARVVVAMTDPNPNVSGQGIARLQAAGIEVVSDIMAAQAAQLNRGFIKRMIQGRPWVTVKLAISVDGKIALANGVSQWITGPEARRDVQRYRAQSCVVLTGSGTVCADNPSLLVREAEAELSCYPLSQIRQPLRVVVNSGDDLATDLKIFNDGCATLVATTKVFADTKNQGQKITLPAFEGRVDLPALMQALGDRQMNEVWVEAGPGLAGALFMANLVDELIVYQAPVLLGDKGQSMVTLPAFTRMDERIDLQRIDSRQVGQDNKIRFHVLAK